MKEILKKVPNRQESLAFFYWVGLVTKGKMAFQKFTKANVY